MIPKQLAGQTEIRSNHLMKLIVETVLRKTGHSKDMILLAMLLKKLNFPIGDKLNAIAVSGKLVIELAEKRPKYKLANLLAKCDLSEQAPQEFADWDNQPLVGTEAQWLFWSRRALCK